MAVGIWTRAVNGRHGTPTRRDARRHRAAARPRSVPVLRRFGTVDRGQPAALIGTAGAEAAAELSARMRAAWTSTPGRR
ncbi:hypothetical protein [Streptomyces sp. NPDC047123]|uniref:hypothetical protein n=1 Tax=Streptomyces sp. NPDC047123 TaxID=3155622 RepID=UPI0033CBE847